MTAALVNAGRHLISKSIQPHVDRCRVNAIHQNMVSLVNQIFPCSKRMFPKHVDANEVAASVKVTHTNPAESLVFAFYDGW